MTFLNLLNKFKGKRKLYEKKIDSLEKKVEELSNKLHPVLIERLYVDRIIVEKMDNSSNIANLGINELGGTLNIGVNYGNAGPKKILDKCKAESGTTESETEPKMKTSPPQDGPVCHIKPRPSNRT